MPGPNSFRSQHEYISYFVEFPGSKFTSVTGGDVQNDVTQQFPGGSGPPENIDGQTTVAQLTLSKPYDTIKDQPILQWSRLWSAGAKTPLTLIKQPVNAAGVPVGEAETFLQCARVSLKTPDVNKGSSDTAMLEVTVQPTDKA